MARKTFLHTQLGIQPVPASALLREAAMGLLMSSVILVGMGAAVLLAIGLGG